MIDKTVKKFYLHDKDQIASDLQYWLSRPADERISAVEILRRQYSGSKARLQRTVGLLNRYKVEYLIVGAYALTYYGAPRYTGDIEIYVRPDMTNAEKILLALTDIGFGSHDLSVDDFSTPQMIIQLGSPPGRIDLITSITAVSWEEAFNNKVPGKFGDVPVFYLGRDEYIANKRATGRKKDIADLESIGVDVD